VSVLILLTQQSLRSESVIGLLWRQPCMASQPSSSTPFHAHCDAGYGNPYSRLWAGRSGVQSPVKKRDFSLLQPQLALGYTQPPLQRVSGSFPRVMRPGSKLDHSAPSSTEVKNEWNYTYTLPYAFMACTGVTLPFILFLLHFTLPVEQIRTVLAAYRWLSDFVLGLA